MAGAGYKLAHAYVEIVPQMQGVGRAITSAFDKYSSRAGKTGGRSSGAGFAKGILGTGAVMGAVSTITSKAFNAIASSLNGAISRVDTMNNFPKVMKNLGYSAQDAAKLVQKMSDRLQGLPTSLDSMTGMVQQLAPVTSSMGEATDLALALNDALLAGGKSTQLQANALEQYNQMLSAGKPDMQAWRSLMFAMPGQLNQVAKSLLGASANSMDLYEALKKGNLTFDDFNQALLKLDKEGLDGFGSFEQQARAATEGIGTAFANMQTRIRNNVAKVIDAIGGENIAGAINSFSSSFNVVGDAAAKMVTDVKNWLGKLWQALQDNGTVATFIAMWDKIRGAISDVVNMVVDWTHFAPPDSVANGIKLLADALMWVVDNAQTLIPILGTFGAALLAVKGYQALTNGLNSLTSTMNAVTTAAQGVSKGVILMMDMGGPVAVIKELAGKMKLVQAAQAAWNAVTTAATAIQGAFNAVLAANPIGVVVVAIGALVAALVWFFTQTEVGRQAWSTFVGWLQQAWQGIVDFASGLWQGLADFFGGLWTTISDAVSTAWDAITSFLSTIWQSIVDVATTIFTTLQTNIVNGFTVLGALLVAPLEAIRTVINTVFEWITGFISGQMESTNGIWSAAWGAIYTVVDTIWTAISTFLNTVIEGIKTFFRAFLDVLQGDWSGAWNEISSFFQNIWNGIIAFVQPIIDSLQSAISTAVNSIKSVWETIWGAISGYFQNIWNQMVAFYVPIINNIRNTISSVINAIRATWNSIWNAISSFFSGIWNGMVNAVSGAVRSIGNVVGTIFGVVTGALRGAGTWLVNIGKNIIQGLINGISSMINKVKDIITGIGSNILGWAQDVLGIHSPSRVMRDKVGVMIGRGLAEGVESQERLVDKAMSRILPEPNPVRIGVHGSYAAGMSPNYKTSSDTTNANLLAEVRALRGELGGVIRDNTNGDVRLMLDERTVAARLAPALDRELGNLPRRHMRGVVV